MKKIKILINNNKLLIYYYNKNKMIKTNKRLTTNLYKILLSKDNHLLMGYLRLINRLIIPT
jgi:hypothetical protein